jgi:hypothetical protein
MNKEDGLFLNQLLTSIEEASKKLERAYQKRDYEKYEEARKEIIKIQKEISGIIK